jgi:O-antigen/teichoic acid export membrane protein
MRDRSRLCDSPALTDVRSNAELTEATATGLRWVTLARVGTEILLVASMIALARLVPPSAFGMFAVAVIVQELAVNVPSEGVGSALVQRRSIGREHLQGALALSLLVGAGLTALSLVLAVVLVQPVFGGETAFLVALTTPWFLLGAVLALPLAVLRRKLDFRLLSLITLAGSAVRSVTSVVFAAAFGLDAPALVLGGLASMVAMVVLALVCARVPLPRWRTQAVRDLLSYGGPASLASVCWVGFRNGDYAIVGARLGAAQAGFYWRGFQLAVEYQRKISTVMAQVAFPVLSRTTGVEAMFELRQRMVRLLTVVIFPLLASLVLLAPVLVPWLFGPAWEPAVLPTQILAGAGAAAVVIDAVGTVLMASGRTRAMLGYGISHFVVYVGAVLFASRWGLAGVSTAAVVIHGVFLIVAYQVLLRGRAERTLAFLWGDVSAAAVSCAALVAAAWPVGLALENAGTPAFVHLAVVAAVAAIAYLAALRFWFQEAWRDLMALFRRVVPGRPLRAAVRRVPMLASRSS